MYQITGGAPTGRPNRPLSGLNSREWHDRHYHTHSLFFGTHPRRHRQESEAGAGLLGGPGESVIVRDCSFPPDLGGDRNPPLATSASSPPSKPSLFPSYGEGMANAFIEALHFDLPCLAYNNTVFPEFIEMGFRITLAEDRDVEDLSAQLLYIAQHIEAEKESVVGNANLAKEIFNIERERKSWADIFV